MHTLEKTETLLTQLHDILGSIAVSTRQLAEELAQVFAANLHIDSEDSLLLTPHIRHIFQNHIQTTLRQNPYCTGAGFASHIHMKSKDHDYWMLEWWLKDNNAIKQALFEQDQGTQQRLDFRTFEWFHKTHQHNTTYIHGPYVDYICNTDYTITSAHAVSVMALRRRAGALEAREAAVRDAHARVHGLDRGAATDVDAHVAGGPHNVARLGLGGRLVAVARERVGAVRHVDAGGGVARLDEAGAIVVAGAGGTVDVAAADLAVGR